MAKKIGAFIALDGEKEFKQAVTDCNKSLSALKSEMTLVSAETTGQANSLETLQKKHDLLSKVLDEQKKKHEAIETGLDNARNSYKKVGDSLEDLRKEYGQAADSLDILKKSSESSEEEIQKQEKAVKDLSDAIESGEKTYSNAGKRVQDWETKLNSASAQVIKSTTALEKNDTYLKEAEQSTDKCAKSIDKFGKKIQEATEYTQSWQEIIRNNLINTGVDALKEIGAAAASASAELEDATNQIQASTGATASEMKGYKQAISEVYSNNFGESLNDIASTMGTIKQYTSETDPTSLQKMTENAITMQDVFNMDLTETIRGADALVKNMGIDSETAFDYMAKGAQNGLDKSGELGDNIAEYSQLWGQAGFSAKDMFSILQNGLDSGAYNLDKVNDFVKEFSISLSDGRVEKSLSSFSDNTGNLFYAWKQGRATTKDVFEAVISDLGNMENKQDALTIASNTWSALGEDNAMDVITSLNKLNDTYDDVHGTMEEIKDIKYDSLTNKWEELGRKFQMEVATPVIEDFLPIAEDGLNTLLDNMDLMVPAIAGIATTAGGLKLATMFGGALTPASTFIGVLGGAAVALATYASNVGEASEKVTDLVDANGRIVDSANNVTENVTDTIADYTDTMANIEAKSDYAETLAQRIETIATNTGRSNAETEVMKEYISDLNEIVPDLNLAYDDQTQSLNKTNEEILNYIDNNEKLLEVQAAEQYKKDLIKERMELEIEEIKLQNQYNDLAEERDSITSGMNGQEYNFFVAMAPWEASLEGILRGQEGLGDLRRSWGDLTDSMSENVEAAKKNKDAQEELNDESEAVTKILKNYGAYTDNSTDALDKNTDAAGENAAAVEAAKVAKEQAQAAEEQYAQCVTDATAQVVESVQSQINIFSKAENLTGDALSEATQTTLDNMNSQMQAMQGWADNLKSIAERGINDGLLKYLADMGPQGADYVAEFASMTDDQIAQANTMWENTMSSADIGATLAGQITGEIDSKAKEIYDSMGGVAANAVTGLTDGLENGKDEVGQKSSELAESGISGTEEGYDINSPSKKMHQVGEYATIGLATGILARIYDVAENSRMVSKSSINATMEILKAQTFYNIGANIAVGLANGISSGRSAVVNATAAMCESAIKQAQASLDIHSPSKVFEGMGEYSAEGYGIGFRNQMQYVQNAVNDSMKFTAAKSNESAGYGSNMTDMVENAIYNGMMNAMSRVKIENNLNGISVNVTVGSQNLVEVLQGKDREFRSRTGYGLFEEA